jgi:transcription initiation factor TFIIH subunit 4
MYNSITSNPDESCRRGELLFANVSLCRAFFLLSIVMSPTSISSAPVGVLDYLQTLSRKSLTKLYDEPEGRGKFVVQAVLSALSPPAQQVVMRLNFTGGAFALSGVNSWLKSSKTCSNVLSELQSWAIATVDETSIRLSEEFYKSLRERLVSLEPCPWVSLTRAQIQTIEVESGAPSKEVSPEDLERYTQSQWDAVLHFLVGSVSHKDPPTAVIQFLLQTGLMQPDPDHLAAGGTEDSAPLVITQRGYDFMLQDSTAQVFHFVTQYLKSLEAHKKGLRQEGLLLLICLGFARVGDAYFCSSLNKEGRVMVKDLAHFGLLYTRKIGKQTIFYPTRVAMQLVTNTKETGSSASQFILSSKALDSALAHPRPHDSSHLAIIVQTNFQLCAYTTSELHVNMLGLFCDVQTIRRLPNIVFMVITRDSVKAAFALGIQAQQILGFLEKHAHPKLRVAGGSPVPSNVVDQIWLWDRERSRVVFTEVYQHECLLPGEFRAVVQYALDRGAHAWSNEQKQQIFIDYSQADVVRNFARQWRAKTAGRS